MTKLYILHTDSEVFHSLHLRNSTPEKRQELRRLKSRQSLKDSWTAFDVEYVSKSKKFKKGDIFSLGRGGAAPAFSQKAVEVLRDFLEPNGELLPLNLYKENEIIYAFNILTFVDILNHEKTKIYIDAKPGDKAYDLVYDEQKLNSYTIFVETKPHLSNHISVTEPFVERVKKYDLKGFYFSLIWPNQS